MSRDPVAKKALDRIEPDPESPDPRLVGLPLGAEQIRPSGEGLVRLALLGVTRTQAEALQDLWREREDQ